MPDSFIHAIPGEIKGLDDRRTDLLDLLQLGDVATPIPPAMARGYGSPPLAALHIGDKAYDAASLLAEIGRRTSEPQAQMSASGRTIGLKGVTSPAAVPLMTTITAVQEGTGDPSPDNVRSITPVQTVTLTRTGTNILDIATCTYGYGWTQNRVTLTKTNTGFIMTTNTDLTEYSGRMYLCIGKRAELVGQTITVTGDYTSSVVDDSCIANMVLITSNTLGGYISGDVEVFAQAPKQNSCTGTVPETGNEYVYVSLYLGYSYTAPAGSTVEWSNIRVNVGGTDLGYEPYTEHVLTTDLPEAVYGGTLDWASGVLTVTHKSVLLDGKGASETGVGQGVWTKGSNNFYLEIADMAHGVPPLCDCYAYVTKASTQAALGEMTLGSVNASIQRVGFGNPGNAIVLDEWVAMCDEQPIQMVYTLKEPYTIQLTPQQLSLMRGDSVLITTGGETTVGYRISLQRYIDDKFAQVEAAVLAMGANI